MWADDRLWIPLLLKGTCFEGHYLFSGDQMLGHRIQLLDSDSSS